MFGVKAWQALGERENGRAMAMLEAGDIWEWCGHDVVGSDGHKIGTLESIYVEPAPMNLRLPRHGRR